MTRRLILVCLTVMVAFSAEDPWKKVRDLHSGVEVRVYKRGSKQPLTGKLDEATEDRISLALKNEQVAVAREDVDRIDYRPAQEKSSRVTRTTKSTTGIDTSSTPGMTQRSGMPSDSTSSSVAIGSKPDFEVLYRRPPKLEKQ